jgi:ketosteroid isomerase-like protein
MPFPVLPVALAVMAGGDTTAQVRHQLDSINVVYVKAYGDTDIKAVIGLYASDASELLDRGQVVRGHDALFSYWHDWMKRNGPIDLTIDVESVWVSGGRLYETGTYTTGFHTKQATTAYVSGHYARIWKGDQGGWKIEAVFDTPTTPLPTTPDRENGEERTYALDTTRGITPIKGSVSVVTFAGRKAVKVTVAPQSPPPTQDTLRPFEPQAVALLDGSDFRDGTIEVWVTGTPAPNSTDTSSRGFVGIAFRSGDDDTQFENIYLRMTNGRAPLQLRRNHAIQYESVPDYRWYRLRRETPGQYESYVDIEPNVWAKLRIVVHGRNMKLYVNDAPQPNLVVTDLKGPETRGRIGLWVGPESVGYFSHLTVH